MQKSYYYTYYARHAIQNLHKESEKEIQNHAPYFKELGEILDCLEDRTSVCCR